MKRKILTIALGIALLGFGSRAQQAPVNGSITTTNGTGINILSHYLQNMANKDQSKYVKITTHIPFVNGQGMTSFYIDYWGYSQVWRTRVGWYIYNNDFYAPSMSISGNYNHNHVVLANEGGYVTINIPVSAFSHYGNMAVSSMTAANNLATDWMNNWTVQVEVTPGTTNRRNLSIENKLSTKGNVGIGTASPQSKLHIATSAPVIKLQNTQHEDTDGGFYGWLGGYDKSGDEIWWLGEGSKSGKVMGFYTNRSGYNLNIFNKGKGITIDGNGNVGIGITDPRENLQVDGALQLGGHSAYRNIKFQPVTALSGYNGTFEILPVTMPGSGVAKQATYFKSATHSSGSTRHDVLVDGNVGLGTVTPLAKLHVQGSTGALMRLSNNGSNYFYTGIDPLGLYFEQVADSPGKSQIRLQTRNSGQGTYTQFFIDGANNSFEFMNGNVGIGTTNPQSKLAVNGSIHAKEVKVMASGWSDFVFEEDYELPSLKEVERHIKEKGHLPDIPSEVEVMKEGITLGEMDSKLLQKIEELTLYMIEQSKRYEGLQKEITVLKQENKALKSALNIHAD